MNHHGSIAKIIAGLLVVAVPFVFVPPTSAQVRDSALSGTIVSVDGNEPVGGAILHAGDLQTGEIYSSAETGADGTFELTDLPAAAFELAVEKDGGLYPVSAPVHVAAGQQRELQVAIHPDVAADPASASKSARGGFWNNQFMAAVWIIGGAFVVGALLSSADNKSEPIASPFN